MTAYLSFLFADSVRRRMGVCGVLVLVSLPLHSGAQSRLAPAPATVVHGLYNWIHSTADSERSFPFYRDVLGIELTRSPFAGPAPAGAPPERIRPLSQAEPDPLIWDLTDTKGARFRNVFMRAPNTPFGIELSEFVGIDRGTRRPNPWDPGASVLIFHVRDLNEVMAKASTSGAPVVTLGGAPVDTPSGRSVLLRDPDGYLIRVTQASPREIADAPSAGQIVGTSIGVTVANLDAALAFYRGLLGFAVRDTRQAGGTELALNGLRTGRLDQATTVIPGTSSVVVLSAFTGTTEPAAPFRWKIQDVGSPQFQLQVSGLDALIERTKTAGYRFLSVGARPIQRPFGRFVFAIDPDGVLVEFVEPSKRP